MTQLDKLMIEPPSSPLLEEIRRYAQSLVDEIDGGDTGNIGYYYRYLSKAYYAWEE